MKILDKFFKKFAYKFDKGYPDMDNPTDVALLESLISEAVGYKFKISENSSVADEAIEILKNELGIEDDQFRKMSGVEYRILIDGTNADRIELLKKINDIENFEYDPNHSGSTIGAAFYGKIRFLVKPASKQGRSSAGMGNEDAFINQITPYLEDGPKNIIFKSPDDSLVQNNVSEVIPTGYDTKDTKKADVILKGSESYPISLKKNNAGFWESADTRYKPVVTKLRNKIIAGDFAPELVFKPYVNKLGAEKEGIYLMHNDVTDKKVTGVVVNDLPEKEEENIIFGTDDAKVVYQSFDVISPEDVYELDGDNLTVKVTKVIKDIDDVEKYEVQPVLNIRHDSTRRASGGLRATVVPYNLIFRNDKITGDKIELSYNEIMS